MRCVITGCAFVEPGGRWVSGDLFQTQGGDWVFNGNVLDNEPAYQSGAPFYSKEVTSDSYWERRGVYIIGSADLVFNQEAQEYLS